jgi:hypothetical protein
MYIIYTEEMPDINILEFIVVSVLGIHRSCNEKMSIVPMMDQNRFQFKYYLKGYENIEIKLFQGTTSSVDYLVTHTKDGHTAYLAAIEETKTSEKESRNTAVYQRISKFPILWHYFPGIRSIMLYNHLSTHSTKTVTFGMKLMTTLGIEIWQKTSSNTFQQQTYEKFECVDDVIQEKNSMLVRNTKDIPVRITKTHEIISISAKLLKGNRLGHDPNKGLIIGVSAVIRSLNDMTPIVVTNHMLLEKHMENVRDNKLLMFMKDHNVSLSNFNYDFSNIKWNERYFNEAKVTQEKHATIFFQIMLSQQGYLPIFSNHGGCARSYLETPSKRVTVPKKTKIPDLVVVKEQNIMVIEGKLSNKAELGFKQLCELNDFTDILKQHYTTFNIEYCLALLGKPCPLPCAQFWLQTDGMYQCSPS